MKKLFTKKFFIIATIIAVAIVGIIIGNGAYQTKKLFGAIESGDYVGVKQAVEKGAWINARKHLLHVPNLIPKNPTPLIVACEKGDEKIISLLLDNGADINKKDSYTGQTPLLAALHGTKENRFLIAMSLLEKGADPFAVQKTTSPLEETLVVLDSDDEQTIEDGFKLFKYLIEQRVDLDICRGKENVLTYASHYGNYNVVEFLIKEEYFDINSKDLAGDTALIAAIKNEQAQIVYLLLELGADKFPKDSEGKTAYDYAVEYGYVELGTFSNRRDKGDKGTRELSPCHIPLSHVTCLAILLKQRPTRSSFL